MNIANSPAVQAVSAAARAAPSGDAVQVLVLKKALDVQQAGAAGLLAALPPVRALATEGSLGTQLDTFA